MEHIRYLHRINEELVHKFCNYWTEEWYGLFFYKFLIYLETAHQSIILTHIWWINKIQNRNLFCPNNGYHPFRILVNPILLPITPHTPQCIVKAILLKTWKELNQSWLPTKTENRKWWWNLTLVTLPEKSTPLCPAALNLIEMAMLPLPEWWLSLHLVPIPLISLFWIDQGTKQLKV